MTVLNLTAIAMINFSLHTGKFSCRLTCEDNYFVILKFSYTRRLKKFVIELVGNLDSNFLLDPQQI